MMLSCPHKDTVKVFFNRQLTWTHHSCSLTKGENINDVVLSCSHKNSVKVFFNRHLTWIHALSPKKKMH